MNLSKKQFFTGALIMVFASVFSKLVGFVFKLPLQYIIGAEGYGLFTYPQNFYVTMVTISTAGFPVAISKLVSERRAENRFYDAHQIFKAAFKLMAALGMILSLIMFLGANNIVDMFWPRDAYYAYMGIVFTPLFVSLLTAFRGYFQGLQQMLPSAISIISESVGRLLTGLGLAYIFASNVPVAAGFASFGATSGAMVGILVIGCIYLYKRKELLNEAYRNPNDQSIKETGLIKKILLISIPIALGSSISTIMALFDSLMVHPILLKSGFEEHAISVMFGQLGAAETIRNLPLGISVAITVSLVPAISSALATKDYEAIDDRINMSLRMGTYIGLPAAIGMFLLRDEIMTLLFPELLGGGQILGFLGLSLPLIMIAQIFASVLQGSGHVYKPVINMVIGSVFKLGISFILLSIPSINILGTAIGTLFAYSTIVVLNYLSIKSEFPIHLDSKVVIGTPIIATLLMGIVVYGLRVILTPYLGLASLTGLVILIAVIVYALCISQLTGIKLKNLIKLIRGK